MSDDHKPNLPAERARIERAGGHVSLEGDGHRPIYRVSGDLSVSRAIGDLRFKQNACLAPEYQIVCCTPDVQAFQRRQDDEFMVLACDGVWDVLDSQQVVDYISRDLGRLRSGAMKPSAVVERIFDKCLSDDPLKTRGVGGDNMTMMIIVFSDGTVQEKRRLDEAAEIA